MNDAADPVPVAGRGHVLVLAANSLRHDARILKQIASLSRLGYAVTAIAIAGEGEDSHDLSDPATHIFRIPMAGKLAEPLASGPGADQGFYDAPVSGSLERFADAQIDLSTVRRAFRLQRFVAGLHWSGKVRKERRSHLRDLRSRVTTMVNASVEDGVRLEFTARYEEAAINFTSVSPEWIARVGDLGPPKIVHAHDLATLVAGAVLADRYGARLIYDAHEYEPERMPPLAPEQKVAVTALEDRGLARADALITVSDSLAEFYRQRQPAMEVKLVLNCPETRTGNARRVEGLRKRLGLAEDTPLAVFVGLPVLKMRGLDITLKALCLCPEFHLAVIGPRWKAQDAELSAATKAMGLSDRVHMLEPVMPDEVVDAIGDADLSICLIQDVTLSYRHSMPNKLFEALVAGVPTIVSDLPDMAALIRRHHAGLVVDQTDPAAVADAMRRILKDRAVYVPTGDARDALEIECTWMGQEKALGDLYSRLLDGAESSLS